MADGDIIGRHTRGLGMEACTRRSLPHAKECTDSVCSRRQWRPAVLHGRRDTWYALSPISAAASIYQFLHYPVFALLGFLSPSNRGSLATVMMICWTFFGAYVHRVYHFCTTPSLTQHCSVGGYVSSRVYASLGGTDKRKNSFLTATALPT
jgi:hypothetical protein